MKSPTLEELERQAGFELLGKLGRGGMGSVYLARYLGHCLVALKLLRAPPEGTTVPLHEYRDRFRRECQVLMSLRHPAIVHAFAFGENPETGVHYLAMEYVQGETLAKLRKQRGEPLDPVETAELLLPIADALCYCHANRVYHRDLSPQNILVTEPSNGVRHAKLVDFGASWYDDAQELTRSVIFGNVDFQPPERFHTDPRKDPDAMGATVDVFALGAIAYFLTGGRGPHGTLLTTDQKIEAEPILEGAHPLWRSLVSEAVRGDSRRRLGSMRAFRDRLAEIVDASGRRTVMQPAHPFWYEKPPEPATPPPTPWSRALAVGSLAGLGLMSAFVLGAVLG